METLFPIPLASALLIRYDYRMMPSFKINIVGLLFLLLATNFLDIFRQKPKITNDDLNQIISVEQDLENRYEAGTINASYLQMAKRLVNRAKYLHGDLTKNAFLENSAAIQGQLGHVVESQFAAGAVPAEVYLAAWQGFLIDKDTQ